MERAEIAFLVQCVTKLTWSEMIEAEKGEALHAKYVAILMMHEEGFNADEIAEMVKKARNTVYTALGRIEVLITGNAAFKTMYLACIKRMAEMEDKV